MVSSLVTNCSTSIQSEEDVKNCEKNNPRQGHTSRCSRGVRSATSVNRESRLSDSWFSREPPSTAKSYERRSRSEVTSRRGPVSRPLTAAQFCPTEGEFERDGKKYVRIICHDHVRDLLIPSQKRNVQTDLIESNRLSFLSEFIETTRKEDLMRQHEENEKLKQRLMEESHLRKKEMQKYKPHIHLDPTIIEREKAANITAKLVKERAIKAIEEEDDDMKKFNSWILGTKCNAIRDAQIVEKKILQEELKKEEKRIEELMEQERLKAIKLQKMKAEEEKRKREAFIKELKHQVNYNNQLRTLEAERLMEERILEDEAFKLDCADNEEDIKKKIEMREKMKQEMNRVNEHIRKVKEVNDHRERIENLRIQEYTKKKLKEAEEREKEKKMLRLAKEQLLVKMRNKQKQTMDNKVTKEEMRALKIKNEVEKEWRAKEKEAILKRDRLNNQLIEERERQIKMKTMIQAVELEAEKEEHQQRYQQFKEHEIKELEEQQHRKLARENLRQNLLHQMSEKERKRKEAKENEIQAMVEMVMKEKYKDNIKRKIMIDKIKEIRSRNVPEKYISAIEKCFLRKNVD